MPASTTTRSPAIPQNAKATPGIDKACVNEIIHTVDFHLGIACSLVVIGFGARDVDFPVGDIEIAAQYNRFVLLKSFDIREKVRIPLLAVFETPEFRAGIGCVYGDQIIVIEFRSDNPALLVVLEHAHIKGNGSRRRSTQ